MNNKLTAVVASADNDSTKTVCGFLEEYGYEVLATTQSGEQAVQIIKDERPQVVLADVYLHDIDACGMLESLKADGYDGDTVFAAVTAINSKRVIESLLLSGADMFVLIPFNAQYTNKKLRELCRKKSAAPMIEQSANGIKDKFDVLSYVSGLMHEVGVPASIRGYDYIRESILMALSDRGVLKAITKELYPSVAKNNDTTASRVERAIRHAVEVAWQRGDVDVLNGIFGYTVKSSKGKPTNGEFISMLTERVKLDLKIS